MSSFDTLIRLIFQADQGKTFTTDRGTRSRYPGIQRSRRTVVSGSAKISLEVSSELHGLRGSPERLRVPSESLDGFPNESTMETCGGFSSG
uniref:Uncharacterized protein n=1 Tax=Hyaloperonospora arabidopsidis (strain Emoy2) TaxID=559515 RepID=M4BTN6_HYAAE